MNSATATSGPGALLDLFTPQPGMSTAAGECQVIALVSQVAGRVKNGSTLVETVTLLRSGLDRIARWHPEVRGPEATFYLAWRANDALEAAGVLGRVLVLDLA